MANLTIKVVNEQGQPLPGVAATLTGVSAPQMEETKETGQAVFQNLAPGRYTLLTALEGLNIRLTPINMEAEDKTIPITLRVADEDSQATKSKWLYRAQDVLQILLLIAVAVIFIWILYKGIASVDFTLVDDDTARGLITFLVAVVTVGIALILVLAAFLGGGKDIEKRFGFGKEVFAILIGVLGTIMGFYYGQAAKGTEAGGIKAATSVVVTPEQPKKSDAKFTVSTALTGGKPPYNYSIKFTPDVVEPADNQQAVNQTSKDGKITRDFKFKQDFTPDPTNGTPLNFVIEVKDAAGGTLSFDNDKEGKKITVKP